MTKDNGVLGRPGTPSAEIIDEIVVLLRDWPDDGKPPMSVARGWAQHFGFIEEQRVEKPCRACGHPQHDYTYMKITPAGWSFLHLALHGCPHPLAGEQ